MFFRCALLSAVFTALLLISFRSFAQTDFPACPADAAYGGESDDQGNVNIMLSTSAMLSSFNRAACMHVTGNLTVALDGAVSLPNVRSVDGTLRILNPVRSLSMPSLVSVGGGIVCDGTDLAGVLHTLSLPSLRSLGGRLFIANTSLTMLELPALSFLGSISIVDNALLPVLNFPSLRTVADTFSVVQNPFLTAISAPLLHELGVLGSSVRLRIASNAILSHVNFPMLRRLDSSSLPQGLNRIEENPMLGACQSLSPVLSAASTTYLFADNAAGCATKQEVLSSFMAATPSYASDGALAMEFISDLSAKAAFTPLAAEGSSSATVSYSWVVLPVSSPVPSLFEVVDPLAENSLDLPSVRRGHGAAPVGVETSFLLYGLSAARRYRLFFTFQDPAPAHQLYTVIGAEGALDFLTPPAPARIFCSGAYAGSVVLSTPEAIAEMNATGCTYISGHLTLSSPGEVSLPSLRSVAGHIIADGGALTTLDLPSLVSVGGEILLRDNSALTSFSAPSLSLIPGDFTVSDNVALTTMETPLLSSVLDHFNLTNQAVLSSLDISSLTLVDGKFDVSGNAMLLSLSAPSLASVDGNFGVSDNAMLSSLLVPSLVSVHGNFGVSDNAMLLSLLVPSLVSVHGEFSVERNDALLALEAGSLSSSKQFLVRNNEVLTTLTLPALESVREVFSVSSNPSLVTLDVSSFASARTVFVSKTALSVLHFPSLLSVDFRFLIRENALLTAIDAPIFHVFGPVSVVAIDKNAQLSTLNFPMLRSVVYNVHLYRFQDNAHLSACQSWAQIFGLNKPYGTFRLVQDNAPGCNTYREIMDSFASVTPNLSPGGGLSTSQVGASHVALRFTPTAATGSSSVSLPYSWVVLPASAPVPTLFEVLDPLSENPLQLSGSHRGHGVATDGVPTTFSVFGLSADTPCKAYLAVQDPAVGYRLYTDTYDPAYQLAFTTAPPTPSMQCTGSYAADVDGNVTLSTAAEVSGLELAGCHHIEGNLIITAPGDITLSHLRTVSGEVLVEDTMLTGLYLPLLEETGGGFGVCENAAFVTLDVPSLRHVGEDLCVVDNALLPTLVIPVEEVLGAVEVSKNPSLTALSFVDLRQIGTYLSVLNNGFSSFELPALEEAGEIIMKRDSSLRTFSLPALTELSGNFHVWYTLLRTFEIPVLREVGGDVYIRENPSLKSVAAPALEAVRGRFFIFDLNKTLRSVRLPSLVTVDTDEAQFQRNSALTTLDMRAVRKIPEFVLFTSPVAELRLGPITELTDGLTIDDTLLTTVHLPFLRRMGGSLSLHGNPFLTTFSTPVLHSVGKTSVVDNNPVLATMDVPMLRAASLVRFYTNNVFTACQSLQPIFKYANEDSIFGNGEGCSTTEALLATYEAAIPGFTLAGEPPVEAGATTAVMHFTPTAAEGSTATHARYNWLTLPADADAPSLFEVVDPLNENPRGVAEGHRGGGLAMVGEELEVLMYGLAFSTAYRVYCVMIDETPSENVYTKVGGGYAYTTLSGSDEPTASDLSMTAYHVSAEATFTPTTEGNYYWRVSSGVEVPTVSQLLNDAFSATRVQSGRGMVDVSMVGRVLSFAVRGLSPETPYTTFLAFESSDGSVVSSDVLRTPFTTTVSSSSVVPGLSGELLAFTPSHDAVTVAFTPDGVGSYTWLLCPVGSDVIVPTSPSHLEVLGERGIAQGVGDLVLPGRLASIFFDGLQPSTTYAIYLGFAAPDGTVGDLILSAYFATPIGEDIVPDLADIISVSFPHYDTMTATFMPDAVGSYHWVIWPDSAAPPMNSAVVSPASGYTARGSDNIVLPGNTETIDLSAFRSRLEPSTAYVLYVVFVSPSGIVGETVFNASFTTPNDSLVPTLLSDIVVNSFVLDDVRALFILTGMGSYEWALYLSSASLASPSTQMILDATGAVASSGPPQQIPPSENVNFAISSASFPLSPLTEYVLYVVLIAPNGEHSDDVLHVSFMTPSPDTVPVADDVMLRDITTTSARMTFVPDAVGSYVWSLYSAGATAPTSLNQLRVMGDNVVDKGSGNITAAGTLHELVFHDLLAGTDYVLYFSFLSPDTMNNSGIFMQAFRTQLLVSKVPNLLLNAGATNDNGITIDSTDIDNVRATFTPDIMGSYVWLLCPNASDIIAPVTLGGVRKGGLKSLSKGSGIISMPGDPLTIALDSLDFSAAYALYLVLIGQDNVNNSAVLHELFATPSAPNMPDMPNMPTGILASLPVGAVRFMPNPVREDLHISLPTAGTLHLYDIASQPLEHRVLSAGETIISFGSYPSGTYVLRVLLAGRELLYRIVKE